MGDAGARASAGTSNASFPLYVLFDILILLGSYLVVIDHPETTAQDKTGTIGSACKRSSMSWSTASRVRDDLWAEQRSLLPRLPSGRCRGHGEHWDAPDGLVVNQLGAGFESASFIRQMTDFARSHRLSLFSTTAALVYAGQKLPINRTPPTTAWSNRPRGHPCRETSAWSPLGPIPTE